MDDGIKKLLDSEDVTNLKLAIIVSGDIEGVANYIIEMTKLNTIDINKDATYSLLDGNICNNDEIKYRLHSTMPHAPVGVELADWTYDIKPLLIDHLNKIANE